MSGAAKVFDRAVRRAEITLCNAEIDLKRAKRLKKNEAVAQLHVDASRKSLEKLTDALAQVSWEQLCAIEKQLEHTNPLPAKDETV